MIKCLSDSKPFQGLVAVGKRNTCLVEEAGDGLVEGEGDDGVGGVAVALPLGDLGEADGHEEGQGTLLEGIAHHAPLQSPFTSRQTL